MWEAIAEYMDGTRIEKLFPYQENGNWLLENKRQNELECWLIEQAEEHKGCIFYNVAYVDED